MDEKGAFTLNAGTSASGVRLDLFVSESLPDLSRSHISNLIKQGHIRVCGQFKKPGYRLKATDTISGIIPPNIPSDYIPEPIPLKIVHEDRHIIVIDKPAGLVVHPAPGHPNGTLVNALLYHCPDIGGIGGEIRPGIVHRLDKDTSGLMIVAKDETSLKNLAAQFKSREVTKEYLAITYGDWKTDSGDIELPIGRHPSDRKKMSVYSHTGRAALTQWHVKARFGGLSYVTANLKTGRTHQIRVHFAALQHPIVGDPVYASLKLANPFPDDVKREIRKIKRQMLHSHSLTLKHPETKKTISFESPPPNDMAQLLDFLFKYYTVS